ncbi:MAG TPA: metallophosphoesterase [Candidatus Heimdallarchaeota archaeon]|nr:metallophosphoesterase [Candidatus Heimdallarchaeota archaeon]
MLKPTKEEIAEVISGPVRPFSVPRPKAARARSRKWHRTVLYSDTHFPFQDDKALAVVLSVIKDVEPDNIIHGGDLLDCHNMSPKFSTDPAHGVSLQQEIDMARAHLHQVSTLAPQARKTWLEGNHEDRVRKTIWDFKGAARELAKLRVFQKNLTWPVLMGLDEIGWDFVPAHGQSKYQVLPKLITVHGTIVNKWSAQTAKAEWTKFGKSGTSGHTHRLGKFYHRDHNGSHVWVETGCTCRLDPEYAEDPDWQQGMVVITHTEDGSRFHMEDIYIQDGKALWRDTLYS